MDYGKIARAVWNGPFHAGPLVRPVGVGDVLLAIVQTIWRGLMVIIAIAAAIALYIWASQPVDLKTKFAAFVPVDHKSICADPERPFAIVLDNRSDRTIRSAAFDIEAYERGRSRNVITSSPSRTSDFVIGPHAKMSTCWSQPSLEEGVDAKSVAYEIKVWSVSEEGPGRL